MKKSTKTQVHPEMREAIDEAMREGLRHWRKKTPAEIMERVRKQMLAEQQALVGAQKPIAFKYVPTCKCTSGPFDIRMHDWDCERPTRIVFFTPEEPKPTNVTIKRRGIEPYLGHSPWSGFNPFYDDNQEGK